MRVAYGWLGELVDLPWGPEELARQLTSAGLKVERQEIWSPEAAGLRVAEVRSLSPVEGSDGPHRLLRAEVWDGRALHPVVTGAPNVAVGQRVVWAVPGARLPGGVRIDVAEFRGVRSVGMLCSPKEVGLDEGSDGLLILAPDAPLGEDAARVIGFGEPVLEFELTVNYASFAQSVFGLAREVAGLAFARLGRRVELRPPELEPVEVAPSGPIEVRIEAADWCPRYAGLVLRNVRSQASPAWLQRRLRQSGMRPVSGLVDITNYAMLELGQPVHAFDAERLRGGAVVVRAARDGERLVTLDGVERRLDPNLLAICDAERPTAVAGVMGGLETEISEHSHTCFLESAHFDRIAVRRAARRLGIFSQAAARFSRGTDFDAPVPAARRVAALCRQVGAARAGELVDVVARRLPERVFALVPDRVRSLLGMDIPDERQVALLDALGLEVEPPTGGRGAWRVRVPHRRPDIEHDVDLAEEIGRLEGYDRLPETLPFGPLTPGRRTDLANWRLALRRTWLGLGVSEAVQYSLVDPSRLGWSAFPPALVREPLVAERSALRPALLASFAEALAYHASRRQERLALFEIGPAFRPDPRAERGVVERERLGVILAGPWQPRSWRSPAGEADFFVLKGLLEAALTASGVAAERLAWRPMGSAGEEIEQLLGIRPEAFHPGRSAAVAVDGGSAVGVAAELHPAWVERLGWPGRALYAEIELEALHAHVRAGGPAREPYRYPPVARDLAAFVPQALPQAELAARIREAAGPRLVELTLFDRYVGPGVPEDKHSLAYRLVYRSDEGTLTDAEVDAYHEAVRRALAALPGVSLRS